MTISSLPTAPSPADTPAEFNSKAFAFLAAMDTFGTEANALALEVDSDAIAAASSASSASGFADAASSSAAAAAGSASDASGHASAASASAVTAGNAATTAVDAKDQLEELYLGSKTSDPSLDNQGNPLQEGALYFNSSVDEMRVYTSSVWVATYLPAASYVTLNGTETLTNKTIAYASNTLTGVVAETSGTASGLTLNDGYTEEVYAVSGTTPALSPTNGSIQTWTLSGNSTPTAGTWAAGQSITLMVDDGTAYTITWTSLAVTWKTDGGSAPTLNTTGYTAIALWKVGSTIYGARVGDA
jgi:hypothetical protein